MPKIGANWFKIKTGDIISFRYKPVDKTKLLRTHTIMVLNSSYPKSLKDGTYKSYLNGLKLEGSNISIFSNREEAWQLLDKIGQIQVVSAKDQIYRIQVNPKFLGGFGAREKLYKEIRMTPIGKKAQYRTYVWEQAKKKSCFYEPIKLPKDKVQMLLEIQGEDIEVISRTRVRSKTNVE